FTPGEPNPPLTTRPPTENQAMHPRPPGGASQAFVSPAGRRTNRRKGSCLGNTTDGACRPFRRRRKPLPKAAERVGGGVSAPQQARQQAVEVAVDYRVGPRPGELRQGDGQRREAVDEGP